MQQARHKADYDVGEPFAPVDAALDVEQARLAFVTWADVRDEPLAQRYLYSLTLPDAIRSSLKERYDRLRRAREGRSVADELNRSGVRCALRSVISSRTDNEILGYDEFGVPTR